MARDILLKATAFFSRESVKQIKKVPEGTLFLFLLVPEVGIEPT
jgi:hypothetical protein